MARKLSRRKGGIVFETLFICVGLGLLVLALMDGLDTFRFISKAETAEGTIQSVEDHGLTTNVEFKPLASTIVAFPQHGFHFNSKQGDAVTVLYDPDRASTASIDHVVDIWFMVALKAIGGFFALLIGLKMRGGRNL